LLLAGRERLRRREVCFMAMKSSEMERRSGRLRISLLAIDAGAA